jgi:hypothetical protein
MIAAVALVILIPVIVIGGLGFYGLSQSDKLPWQTPPTRIPITPVEMPSFGTIGGTPLPTSTVQSHTPAA